MPRRTFNLFDRIAAFQPLCEAAQRAARGKRGKPGVAAFLAGLERNVLRLEEALQAGTWRPGAYTVMEVKDAGRSFTLRRAYLMSLFKDAARQNKDAVLVVEFPDLTVRATITRKQ